ncbi:hypothetical protein [Bradyrhizobium sp. USDA 4486]
MLVTNETVAEACDRLYYLERACQAQLYEMQNRELRHGAPAVVDTITQSGRQLELYLLQASTRSQSLRTSLRCAGSECLVAGAGQVIGTEIAAGSCTPLPPCTTFLKPGASTY